MANVSETRREFLLKLGAAGASLALGGLAAPTMPTRKFGKIGWNVGIIGVGTAELPDEATAVASLNAALDGGANYIDTAPSYQGGLSESYVGKLARQRRGDFYLATKTLMRDSSSAARDIEASLRRLQTDHVDLLQVHAVNSMADLDSVLRKGGAIEAIEEAKKLGRVRHVGITGHTRPEVLLMALDRHPFEAVLVPISAADSHLHDFAVQLVPKAVKMGVAVIGMKALKGRERSGQGISDPTDLLHFALSHPVSVVVVGLTAKRQVRQNLAAAYGYKQLSSERMASIRVEAKGYANSQVLWWKAR